MTLEEVYTYLDSLDIEFTEYTHPAVFTIEESKNVKALPNSVMLVKNLFLKDKKGAYFLYILPGDTACDLKELQTNIGCKRLSFARPDEVVEILGVKPGSISLLNLIQAKNADSIGVYLHADLVNKGTIGFHPNKNTKTITISYLDVLKVCNDLGVSMI